MKKTILLGILFTLLGAYVGHYLYTNNSLQDVFNEKKTYYFLQEGVYSSKDIMTENVKDINNKLVVEEDDKFYVYVGITKDSDISKKIKDIYEDEGYQIYEKEMSLNNSEFDANLDQFDLLIKNSNDKEDILTVEGVVLANYEEIIQNNK